MVFVFIVYLKIEKKPIMLGILWIYIEKIIKIEYLNHKITIIYYEHF